jgi:hypothetical protein
MLSAGLLRISHVVSATIIMPASDPLPPSKLLPAMPMTLSTPGVSRRTLPMSSITASVRSSEAALGNVVLVTYVFLQDWRATLIPTLTIPVSLVDTCIGPHFPSGV